MKYVSTRGGMAPQAFSDILLEGLAPDGGLAVPETLPRVDAATLESWRGLPYADLAFEVLSRFATDIPAEDLRRLTRAAYTPQIFNSEDIVPLRPLNDETEPVALDTTLRGGDKVYVEKDGRYFLSLGAAGKEAQIPFPSDKINALDAASLIGGVNDTDVDAEAIGGAFSASIPGWLGRCWPRYSCT